MCGHEIWRTRDDGMVFVYIIKDGDLRLMSSKRHWDQLKGFMRSLDTSFQIELDEMTHRNFARSPEPRGAGASGNGSMNVGGLLNDGEPAEGSETRRLSSREATPVQVYPPSYFYTLVLY